MLSLSSASISSIVGKLVFNSLGSALDNWYSEIPLGALIFRSAYSAIILFFDLHNKIPIVGLSCYFFNRSSAAAR